MSTLSKWLLLFLLTLLFHLSYVAVAAVNIAQGGSSLIHPFGSVNYVRLFGFVQIEFYLMTIVLIGFGVSLFRSDE
jgi:hypothetical protein